MSEIDKTQPILVLDNQDEWVQDEVKRRVWTGPFHKAVEFVDQIYNWGRRSSIWPMQFGLACCAIEMICASAARFDIARFGMELFRPSPRQADLMIVAGTVTKKMVPNIVRLYNQMAEPKYVLAMGACASAGGPFKEGYNVVPGIDKFLPVDVYVPGCPPTPQALLNGLITLQKKIDAQSVAAVPWYQAETHEAIPEPVYGPDLYDSRRGYEIKQLAADPDKQEALYVHIASRAETKHGKKDAETETRPQPAAAQAAARAAKPLPTAPTPAQAAPRETSKTPAVQPDGASSAAQANTVASTDISKGSAAKAAVTEPGPGAVSPAPGMVSQVIPPAGGSPAPTRVDTAVGDRSGSTPAAPRADASAPIEANRGEVRPIPANEPDKLMLDRAYNPPGQRDPNRPAAAGLPKATPKDQSKLAELKADADFAARAERIHQELAKATPQSRAAAEGIEQDAQSEVRSKLDARSAEEGRLVETEPNAGESKEATKEYFREIGADQTKPSNTIVQPTGLDSKVATEKYRKDVVEPPELHQDDPDVDRSRSGDKTEE